VRERACCCESSLFPVAGRRCCAGARKRLKRAVRQGFEPWVPFWDTTSTSAGRGRTHRGRILRSRGFCRANTATVAKCRPSSRLLTFGRLCSVGSSLRDGRKGRKGGMKTIGRRIVRDIANPFIEMKTQLNIGIYRWKNGRRNG
jgi:hypothetical protein